MHNIIITLYL